MMSLRETERTRRHVPLDVVDEGRLQVVEPLLVKLRIYNTEVFVRRRVVRPHPGRQKQSTQRDRSPVAWKERDVLHRNQTIDID